MRIVYFGTPAFAVPTLDALLEAGHDIAAVVTQPDRPQGRSRSTLVPPPVKELAESRGLTVLQPDRPVGDLFAASLKRFEADLGVVVAYGHILKPAILAIPRLGMLNVHASILPRWRGAAPIQWSIAAGDRATGVSIMWMEAGLDSGPVIDVLETPIGAEESGGELTARLATLGAEALADTVARLETQSLPGEPQDAAFATYAPKLDRAVARIDWTEPAAVVARKIRAFDPVPGAWCILGGSEIKLFRARAVPLNRPAAPGLVVSPGPALVVAAGDGAVEIDEVQPAGRKRLASREWLRGRASPEGSVLA